MRTLEDAPVVKITREQMLGARARIPDKPDTVPFHSQCYVQIDDGPVYALFENITIGLPVWHFRCAYETLPPKGEK